MKAIILAVLSTVFSFIFLHRPVVAAVGGRAKLWKLLIFDWAIGVGVYLLLR